MVSSVKYLGHIIDANGLHPAPDKLKAVKNAPAPQNVTELKAYLGLLTYYSKFLPNMATTLSPLYMLLHNNVKWQWTSSEAKAFQESKDLLTSNSLLVHFNPSQMLTLMCDASQKREGLFCLRLMNKVLRNQLHMLHAHSHSLNKTTHK